MSSRAMRKLRGDTLDEDLKNINNSKADDDEDDDDDDLATTGGRGVGGGARPKQRINPFEMVSICDQCQEYVRTENARNSECQNVIPEFSRVPLFLYSSFNIISYNFS